MKKKKKGEIENEKEKKKDAEDEYEVRVVSVVFAFLSSHFCCSSGLHLQKCTYFLVH